MPVTINGTTEITTPALVNGTALAFRNKIINGDMQIDQRNSGASVTQQITNSYPVDRFTINGSVASKFTAQQNQNSVTPPSGFSKYLGITSSSSYSVAAGDYFYIAQAIEGFNISNLGFGTANASPITLSFWVRSSLTGTFSGSIRNNGTRSYPFTYTISSANTWTLISITIPGDTTGTWASDNTAGMWVFWGLGAGSTFSGTAGSWQAGNFVSATGATSVVGTNGATFYITGVQLEAGSVATPFENRPVGTELALCQRYCLSLSQDSVVSRHIGSGIWTTTTGGFIILNLPIQMRSIPTLSFSSASDFGVNNGGSVYSTTGISINGSSSSNLCLAIDFVTASGGTAGYATRIYMNNLSSRLTASAEL